MGLPFLGTHGARMDAGEHHGRTFCQHLTSMRKAQRSQLRPRGLPQPCLTAILRLHQRSTAATASAGGGAAALH